MKIEKSGRIKQMTQIAKVGEEYAVGRIHKDDVDQLVKQVNAYRSLVTELKKFAQRTDAHSATRLLEQLGEL